MRFDFDGLPASERRFFTLERFRQLLLALNVTKEEILEKDQYVRMYLDVECSQIFFNLDKAFVEDLKAFERVVQKAKHFYFNTLFGVPGSWFDSVPHYRYYVYLLVHNHIKANSGTTPATVESVLANQRFMKTCAVQVICEKQWKHCFTCVKPMPKLTATFTGRWNNIWDSPDFDFNTFIHQVSDHLWFVREIVLKDCDARQRMIEMKQVQEQSVYWCKVSQELEAKLAQKEVELAQKEVELDQAVETVKGSVKKYIKRKNDVLENTLQTCATLTEQVAELKVKSKRRKFVSSFSKFKRALSTSQ